jgi:hypothetical protein
MLVVKILRENGQIILKTVWTIFQKVIKCFYWLGDDKRFERKRCQKIHSKQGKPTGAYFRYLVLYFIKATVAPISIWLKVARLNWGKLEEPLIVFKLFYCFFDLLINFIRTTALWWNWTQNGLYMPRNNELQAQQVRFLFKLAGGFFSWIFLRVSNPIWVYFSVSMTTINLWTLLRRSLIIFGHLAKGLQYP